ncbi:Ni/Fe hydrogenase [Clostridium botulinum]|nr:Ni/Fe hydrogenase [Clostridium botulinum]
MGKIITIDPITRISGFLEIKVKVEDNIIVDGETSGLLFRGFEKMLEGRPPLDSIYFTERICGICSTAHATASTLALENALNITPSINDIYIRDMMHGFEFIQNHLRQFYCFTVPSYVNLPNIRPIYPQEYSDFRLPKKLNERISSHYEEGIKYSRLAHEALAVLGGKAPHSHGIFVGGVTVNIDSYKLTKIQSILKAIKKFVNIYMLEDMNIIAQYYPEYFNLGNTYGNFMSFGVFDKYKDKNISYVKPGVIINNKLENFDRDKITENIRYAWYVSDTIIENPIMNNEYTVDLKKEGAYSFVKAPRYADLPMEVGPLARLKIAGEYTGGNSSMDRNIARVLETKKIINILYNISKKIQLLSNNQSAYNIPEGAFGEGLIDTTRGALSHFIKIENKTIKYYNIITPTAWNISPKDSKGTRGVGEKSLIGSKIDNIEKPVEIGRIIRSFDPCISCATHLVSNNNEPVKVEVLV